MKANSHFGVFFTYKSKDYFIESFQTDNSLKVLNPVSGLDIKDYVKWWSLTCDIESSGVVKLQIFESNKDSSLFEMEIKIGDEVRKVHFNLIKCGSLYPENYRIAKGEIIT